MNEGMNERSAGVEITVMRSGRMLQFCTVTFVVVVLVEIIHFLADGSARHFTS